METMTNYTIIVHYGSLRPLIDDRIIIVYTYLVFCVLCPSINIFGIVSNIINIMCFVRQGFKEPINISLMGLAISDIGCLVTSCLGIVVFIPAVTEADLPFDIREVSFPIASMPHLMCSRITTWITAIITIERCLCVLVPLKIKSIITPRRMFIVIASVFVILISCGVPIYFVKKLGMKFYPSKNRTLLGLITIADGEYYTTIYITINSFIIPFLAFILICICTAILVYNLRQQTKWRNASSTASAAGVSKRSHKVVKMVVMISALYISCTIPITITMLILAIEPSFNIGGSNINVGVVCGGIALITESINSSANIYIYFHMSSKFKEAFSSIFCQINKNMISKDGVH